MGEQVAITDRSKKRQGGHDRLGHHPSHHRLRHESRREPPQPPAGAAELRHDGFLRQRSEERRVGKECRSRWSPSHLKKKKQTKKSRKPDTSRKQSCHSSSCRV